MAAFHLGPFLFIFRGRGIATVRRRETSGSLCFFYQSSARSQLRSCCAATGLRSGQWDRSDARLL